ELRGVHPCGKERLTNQLDNESCQFGATYTADQHLLVPILRAAHEFDLRSLQPEQIADQFDQGGIRATIGRGSRDRDFQGARLLAEHSRLARAWLRANR